MDKQTRLFMELRIESLKLMKAAIEQITQTFENAMESIFELIGDVLDDYVRGTVEERYGLIEFIKDSAGELFTAAEGTIDQVARGYVADLIFASSDWAHEIGLGPADVEQTIRAMEQKASAVFKNPIRANRDYIMNQFESVLLDNVIDADLENIKMGMVQVLNGK